MNDVARMAENHNFVGGIRLADMAMRLAEHRAGEGLDGFWTTHRIEPCSRDWANPATHQVSANYYLIIDRIARGEKP